MPNALLYPMAAHVALAAFLYALLTVVRAPSVWGVGRKPDGSNPWVAVERRVSANLSNQFEWPVIFYAVCLLALQFNAVDRIHLLLAWVFIAGRIAHSLVHVLTTNVRLRGVVFTINFAAVLGMWAWLLASRSGLAK